MSRPMRRAWEGALVLLFASNSLAGMAPIAPAREDDVFFAEVESKRAPAEVVAAPIVAESPVPVPTIDHLAAEVFSDRFEPFPDLIEQRTPILRTLSIDEQPALQATAVPLPPALWPGVLTLSGVALAMVIRQHRRA